MQGQTIYFQLLGTARFASPLNVWDFTKQMSVIKYNKKSLLKCAKDIEAFAKAELLEAHAKSIEIRRMDK